MAKKVWRGDAPDVPQIEVVEFAGDPIVAEGSDLIFAINDKQIVVEAASAIADVTPEVAGDSGGVSTLLSAAAAAINGSEIPEFAEIEAAVEVPDPSLEAPFHRLTLTGREPVHSEQAQPRSRSSAASCSSRLPAATMSPPVRGNPPCQSVTTQPAPSRIGTSGTMS